MGYRNGTVVHLRDDIKCQPFMTTNDHDQYDGPIDGHTMEAGALAGEPAETITHLDVAHDASHPTIGGAVAMTEGTWHYLAECADQYGAPAL